MDGTGTLFKAFIQLLPEGIDVRVVSYPEDTYLTYEQLAERVTKVVPDSAPYVIIAESYSGPVASLLAAQPVGNLQAVVFVSSFVSLPCGRIGAWIAKVVPIALFHLRAPTWILRWFLMNSDTPPEMISEVRDAITRVLPDVLARRFRDALNADYVPILRNCTVRIVCLLSESDRLLGTRGLRGFIAARPDIETVKIAGPHFLLQCAPDSCFAVLRNIRVFGDAVTTQRPPR